HIKFLCGVRRYVAPRMGSWLARYRNGRPTLHNFHQRLRRNCISATSSFRCFGGLSQASGGPMTSHSRPKESSAGSAIYASRLLLVVNNDVVHTTTLRVRSRLRHCRGSSISGDHTFPRHGDFPTFLPDNIRLPFIGTLDGHGVSNRRPYDWIILAIKFNGG